jgi:outer membrane protein OmpA-like peptidoglycan-associated protein
MNVHYYKGAFLSHVLIMVLSMSFVFQSCTSFYPKFEDEPKQQQHEVELYEKPYYKKNINTFGWLLNLGISGGAGYAAYQYAPTTPLMNLGTEAGVSLSDKDARLIQGIGAGLIMGLVNYAIMNDRTRKELISTQDAQTWIRDYDNRRKVVEFSIGRHITSIPKDGDARFAMKNINDARFFAEQFPKSIYADNVITRSLSDIPTAQYPELVTIFPDLDVSAKIKMQLIMNSSTLAEWLRNTSEYPDIMLKADSLGVQKKIRQLCPNLNVLAQLVNTKPAYVSMRTLELIGLDYVRTHQDILAYRNIFPSSSQEQALETIAIRVITNFESCLKVKQMFSISSQHTVLDSIAFSLIRSMNDVAMFKREFHYSSFLQTLSTFALQYVVSLSDIGEYAAIFPNELLIDQIIQQREATLSRTDIIFILEKVTFSKRISVLKRRLVDISSSFDECIEASEYAKEFNEDLANKCLRFLSTSSDYRRFLKYFKQTEIGRDQQFKYYELISKEAENLGDQINSEYGDYAPKISPDGETLYFIRMDHPDGYGGEDIFVSYLKEDDEWSEAVNIGTPLNNSGHNGVYSVSQDGQELFLHNQYQDRGNNPSITRIEDQVWTEPETQYIPELNSNGNYHNGSLSVDGKYLLMSVNRYDSFGGNDIYAILKDEFGNWQEPINLGETINTYAEEGSVFIAADGQTIYFSSAGHPGFGDQDMFMSRRLDNSWTNWSTPVNLGEHINSPEKDNFYVIPAKGDFIYFSSTRDGYGKEDIYRIGLPMDMRPKPVTLVKGRVFNRKDNQSIPATVYYEDLETGEVLGSVRTNSKTGEYQIILVVGRKYGYYAVADKYLSQSENMDLVHLPEYRKENQNLTLVPIETGQSITMNNLFFDTKQWTLKPESYLELNRIVKFLEQNPQVKIEIGGHTDDVGSDENNQILSAKRAYEVYQYFVSKSVTVERLLYIGYGETKPKVPNTSDYNRALNRRVELMIR